MTELLDPALVDSALLEPALLARIHGRAAGYDARNEFFAEDLAELAASGYLASFVPVGMDGPNRAFLEVVRAQRRLAAAAPATALGVGMHLIWTSVARSLHDDGDRSLDFVLADAAAGEVFAFAISEPGNDLVLFGSTTDAAPRPDGSYAFTGTKVFTSLSPAWTRLATFGLDQTSADAPRLVHAVLTRDADGIEVIDDWDTLGMRATRSNTTRLHGAVAAAERVHRRLDPGPSADPLIRAIFVSFELLISAVYAGIADRALDLAIEAAQQRTSMRSGTTLDQDPAVRSRIADAAMLVDALTPRLERLAADIDAQVDLGDQAFRHAAGLKLAATSTARAVIDAAVAVTGGGAYRSGSELERLARDVMAGPFHPSSEDSVRSTVATAVLGPPVP